MGDATGQGGGGSGATPLVTAGLPQLPRNAGPDGLGFTGPGFRALIALNVTAQDLRTGATVSGERAGAVMFALREARRTIVDMPARYTTLPNSDARVFEPHSLSVRVSPSSPTPLRGGGGPRSGGGGKPRNALVLAAGLVAAFGALSVPALSGGRCCGSGPVSAYLLLSPPFCVIPAVSLPLQAGEPGPRGHGRTFRNREGESARSRRLPLGPGSTDCKRQSFVRDDAIYWKDIILDEAPD